MDPRGDCGRLHAWFSHDVFRNCDTTDGSGRDRLKSLRALASVDRLGVPTDSTPSRQPCPGGRKAPPGRLAALKEAGRFSTTVETKCPRAIHVHSRRRRLAAGNWGNVRAIPNWRSKRSSGYPVRELPPPFSCKLNDHGRKIWNRDDLPLL